MGLFGKKNEGEKKGEVGPERIVYEHEEEPVEEIQRLGETKMTVVAIKGDGTVGLASEEDKANGTTVNVEDISDSKKKLEENPHMKDVGQLNSLAEKAVSSAGALYRGVEIVHKGAIPLDLVVTSLVTAVEDFNNLKDELHKFQLHGRLTMEDILDRFGEIMDACNHITRMLQDRREPIEIVVMLDDIVVKVQGFLELVNERCKELQRLRKKTADTWLATTSVASVTVGGAAAALCVLSGGAALPVLAPLIAFGAGTTAVATASHIAFSPSLGAQIKDMDEQIKQLDHMRMQAGSVGRKAESKKIAEIVGGRPIKKFWW